MHQMTHQKIVPTRNGERCHYHEKHRTNRLNRLQFPQHPDTRREKQLLQIIAKWERGNFSEADKDHNYICDLQNGALRKARGLLSKEEELQIIEEWFIEGKAEEDATSE